MTTAKSQTLYESLSSLWGRGSKATLRLSIEHLDSSVELESEGPDAQGAQSFESLATSLSQSQSFGELQLLKRLNSSGSKLSESGSLTGETRKEIQVVMLDPTKTREDVNTQVAAALEMTRLTSTSGKISRLSVELACDASFTSAVQAKVEEFQLLEALKDHKHDTQEYVEVAIRENVPLATWAPHLGYFSHLQSLDISSASLTTLPEQIFELRNLELLQLHHNRLTRLPDELGNLTELRLLTCDYNQLDDVPATIHLCTKLEELSLEGNKLVKPKFDFRQLKELHTVRLAGNQLEYLPAISPLDKLVSLSLANVRIDFEDDRSGVRIATAEDGGSSGSYLNPAGVFSSKTQKWEAFFSLAFRSSSCQHPLLASAIARIAKETSTHEAFMAEKGAVQQLLAMALSDSLMVVKQACSALASLASATPAVALRLVESEQAMMRSLLKSTQPAAQVSALRLVASLALTSPGIADALLTDVLLDDLLSRCARGTEPPVQRYALLALGNISFHRKPRLRLQADKRLMPTLLKLARVPGSGDVTLRQVSEGSGHNMSRSTSCDSLLLEEGGLESVREAVRLAAIRCLAILGMNDEVARAVGKDGILKRQEAHGIRILSLDGGGMRGLVTIQILRRIEAATGRKIHEMFDLICGTSTGGILAAAISLKRMELDDVENMYKRMNKRVFAQDENQANSGQTARTLGNLYKWGSTNFRVLLQGCKYSSASFEALAQEICDEYSERDLDIALTHSRVDGERNRDYEQAIDTAVFGCPKSFVVASLVSVSPVVPYIFRNYEYPPGTPEISDPDEDMWCRVPGQAEGIPRDTPSLMPNAGTCKVPLWKSIRASSAAPYYFDDFTIGECRFHDGAVIANNPAVLGLREARCLWPNRRIACLLSVGSGTYPPRRRAKTGTWVVDTGLALADGAMDVEAPAAALETIAQMMDLPYVRINPVDSRYEQELDDISEAQINRIIDATNEFLNSDGGKAVIDSVANTLLATMGEEGAARTSLYLIESEQVADSTFSWEHVEVLRKSLADTQSMHAGSQPMSENCFRILPSARYPALTTVKFERLWDGVGSEEQSSLNEDAIVGRFFNTLQGCLGESSSTDKTCIHICAYCTATGLVLKWDRETVAVIEGSQEAILLVRAFNAQIGGESPCDSLSDVFREVPYIWLDDILYRFLGRHTQAVGSGSVDVFLLNRVKPAATATPGMIRQMQLSGNMITDLFHNAVVSFCFPCSAQVRDAFLDVGATVIFPEEDRIISSLECVELADDDEADGRPARSFHAEELSLLTDSHMQGIDILNVHRDYVQYGTEDPKRARHDLMEYHEARG